MTKIFISYRRSDDPYAARGINDALVDHFGEENVYFDLDALQAGLDWREQIDNMVAECDVMLVVIGDEWLQVDASGRSRLENETDLVRLEVSSALKRGIPVIPVLVGNATILAKESLPEELEPLVYRQATEVRATANFGAQIDRLLKSIKAVAPEEISLEVTQAEVVAPEPKAVSTEDTFSKVASSLKHPLVLIGFAFMLVMWLFGKLIDSGIIPELDQVSGSVLLKSVIDYSVWIGFVIVASGVLLQLSRARRSSRWVIAIATLIMLTVLGMMVFKQWEGYRTDVTAIENDNLELQLASEKKARKRAEALVDMLVANSSSGFVTETDNEKDEQIEVLTATITTLQNQEDTDGRIASALKLIDEKGDIRQAEAIFQDILDEKLGEGKQANLAAAEAARHLGSLAFLNDTEKALAAYRQATELDPDNGEGWIQIGRLLKRVGELDEAILAYQKADEIGKLSQDKVIQARANRYLGTIYLIRGELGHAKTLYHKALAINKALGNKEGTAATYTNLGVVSRHQGDLDEAENMYHKALAIHVILDHKEGMAADFVNLGVVFKSRGELDQAEDMYRKALTINKALDRKVGMANDYTNLGIIYKIRDDLDQAEAMFDKALTINVALGNKVGMAMNYTNLGNVYKGRGDLDQAENIYLNALAINKSLGRKKGVAINYNNLGNVYKGRGETDKALESWKKAESFYTEIGALAEAEKVKLGINELQESGSN